MKNKKTVKEAIEHGLKVGDEVWIKGQVKDIDRVNTEIPLKVLSHWFGCEEEICLPTDTEPEAEPKLEVGQYWHSLEGQSEFIVEKDINGIDFICTCTKQGITSFHLGEKVGFCIRELQGFGYAIGRHPDNVEPEWLTLAECKPCVGDVLEYKYKFDHIDEEIHNITVLDVRKSGVDFDAGYFVYFSGHKCFRVKSRSPQPEQWQPKEGELVWVKDHHDNWEGKGRIIQMPCGNMLAVVYYSYTWMVLNLVGNELDLKPYNNQDKSIIDFSVAGQWLRNAEDGIVCTFGELGRESESIFLAVPFGAEFNRQNTQLHTSKVAWQLLTPEQMQPILQELENLKRKA